MRYRLWRIGTLLPLLACAQWEGTQIFYNRRSYTRADTLLGSLSPYRSCYDVTHYRLHVSINPSSQSLRGEVTCTFRWLGGSDTIQIDLEPHLHLSQVEIDGSKASFIRIKGTRAVWISLPPAARSWEKGSLHRWTARYSGKPRRAPRPPWDGGIVWEKTPDGSPWIGVACQGLGASLWWPLKDHLSDEPDSATMTFCVPAPLRVISNGRLLQITPKGTDTCFTYQVSYPINTYNITFYAAPGYTTHTDTFFSTNGTPIPLRFSVLPQNANKIPYLREQAIKVLRAFEHYFGPFPVPRDGYGLVESPYYGMEHQSAIAYGNRFQKDPLWGFDYIILHETGHEWWGNHVSAADNADLWIQEGFCTYGEALFLEYYHGYQEALQYLLLQRLYIQNRQTIQAPYGVNADQTYNTDIYYKTAWVLHTLRSRVNNDSLWFSCLRAIQDSFSFKAISAAELIAFMSRRLGEDLTPFFRAYLYYLRPPVVQYKVVKEGENSFLEAHWLSEEKSFEGPMEFLVGEQRLRFYLKPEIQRFPLPKGTEIVMPDRNRFLVIASPLP
ncbi:MAG: M1 family metallopeptidase [Bacteroidia bacterium]|nr:M1 family metallopeptidase [Bacteroidia bacterium]MCX7763547.1 M1 family metallopeptidase [Bacteroidia bacterium]MDW8058370.1 M1 family metallopeptidase [Bacteroidia bacterium]